MKETEKSNFTSRIIGPQLQGQPQEPELPHPVPRCACYHIVTPKECMALRYGYDLQHDGTDETCECSCHDAWYEEQEDFYAEQSQ